MTEDELSIEFDILYDNISSNQAPGLTDYEKSVFLTEAKEEFIKSVYSGQKGIDISFEKTEEVRRYLDSLIDNAEIDNPQIDKITLPEKEKLWFIVHEEALGKHTDKSCYDTKAMEVTPITYDEYSRIMRDPFRKANYRRVLRLDVGENTVRLIPSEGVTITKYLVTYLRKPEPVTIGDLGSLSINGSSGPFTDDLHDNYLWRVILNLAVQKAIAVYSPRVSPK